MDIRTAGYASFLSACLTLLSCTPMTGDAADGNQGEMSGGGDTGPMFAGAWVSGRIVYADIESGKLTTTTEQGDAVSTLIEAQRPACPAVSGDGQAIAFSLRDREPGQLVVLFRDGRVNQFEGITGHDPLRVALSADGSKIAFQELTPPEPTNGCGPIHQAFGNSDGTDLSMVVSGDTVCAEWPEWSPDGAMISYAHVDVSNEVNPGRVCLLDGADGSQLRCFDNTPIGIAHRTWSPDGSLLLNRGFLALSASDGTQVPDPLASVQGNDPALGNGELATAVVNAVAAIGWTLVPAGDVVEDAVALPISLNWGANNKIVFDAVASDSSGPEAVHIFTYDLATGTATHAAGPFLETDTNGHNFSLLCPRWIP